MANTTTLPDAHWYIVHAYSNFEKKVADEIKKQAISHGLGDLFEEVLVPTEEVVEVRRGQKVNAERKFFPGYVLVKARLTTRLITSSRHAEGDGIFGHGLKTYSGAPGGSRSHFESSERRCGAAEAAITFEIGEQVRVADGPFTSFNGTVEEIDEDRSRLKVAVSIFGRATPVELDFAQVEKL